MISKKILVQSAAAGLMAGAIFAMPLFLYGPEHGSFDQKKPCSYKNDKLEISYGPYGQPAFRAAPPVNRQVERAKSGRTLEERNQAARRMLGEIHDTYETEQAAVDAANSFAVRTMAAQTATRIRQHVQTRSDGQYTASEISEAAMLSSEAQKTRALELMRRHGPMWRER